jgi:hypothetical protein
LEECVILLEGECFTKVFFNPSGTEDI